MVCCRIKEDDNYFFSLILSPVTLVSIVCREWFVMCVLKVVNNFTCMKASSYYRVNSHNVLIPQAVCFSVLLNKCLLYFSKAR